MQNNFLSGDDLISNFSTTYAKKNYVDDAATTSFQTSTNIDFSKYNFITINYYIHSVNRPKATVTVAGTVFSICPYGGTYTISIPVSDINIVGSIIFNAKDSGGGTSDIKYVQIQVNSIYGY